MAPGILYQFMCSEMPAEVLDVRFKPALLCLVTKFWLLIYSRNNVLTVCGSQGVNKTYCTVSASHVCVCRGILLAFLAAGGTLLGWFYVFFSHHGLVMKKTTRQGFVAKAQLAR